jgi:glycosyltransferase involved in cell wall biosynthesis
MKVVVFAHTPPPFHGQSYMVELMLAGLKSRDRDGLQIFHVNASLSDRVEEIGKFKWKKLFLLMKYCVRAWRCHLFDGADTFYYIPAPGKRNAVYRDWLAMVFCRPIFKRIIFHWHAAGLGSWLEKEAKPWERRITRRLLGRADLSIVLSEFGRADAMCLSPKRIEIVPNGIPDPCPDFEKRVLSDRQRRQKERSRGELTSFIVLFAGTCSEAKGLFATLDAVALVNQQFTDRRLPISVSLVVAGEFLSNAERNRFNQRIARSDLNACEEQSRCLVDYVGFVSGPKKDELFRRCDCLCFPSLYPAEGQPVTIIEALAFGLPVVATRWRGIPDLLAGSEARLIDDQDPKAIANALKDLLNAETWTMNRKLFLDNYSLDKYVDGLKCAFAKL